MGEMAVGTQYRQPASAEFSWQQALTRIDRESVCSSPLLFVLLPLLVLLLGCDRFGASRLFVSCRRRGNISVNLGPLGRRVVRVEKGWRPSPCLACTGVPTSSARWWGKFFFAAIQALLSRAFPRAVDRSDGAPAVLLVWPSSRAVV
ncbi:unnamed protein product [Prorocentrum cordatum]|uniref:Uncharacterized protein n=1 Tax=Prorocentrum cordatum TaxID=2364126 RepID=A0ABN9RX94_9DINO|nr:unnamed protein product [Polarella glacialis]